jgi:hypothetical protein
MWQQKLMNVCFATPGWFADKDLFKGALKGQRSWEGAGNIVFTGFRDCNDLNEPGVHITIRPDQGSATDDPNNGVIRMALDWQDPEATQDRCTYNGLGREECIVTVGLHEFGHALGIAHEHMRGGPTTPWYPELTPCGFNGFIGDATYGPYDAQSLMTYCGFPTQLSATDRKGFQLMYGQRDQSKTRLSDVNNDGRADLICYDTQTGYRWVDYANPDGQYDAIHDFHGPAPALTTCAAPHNRIYKGEFSGPGTRVDLLCVDYNTGPYVIDFAAATSTPYASWDAYAIPDWGWCNHPTGRIFVGDFNGDTKDDLMCHDESNGSIWIDYNGGAGGFTGTNFQYPAGWCWGKNGSLHIGRFNNDLRSDLLCHDRESGQMWIEYADANGQFHGVPDWYGAGKCNEFSEEVLIGDFNGDSRDDFLCHDMVSGFLQIDLADANQLAVFSPTMYDSASAVFCAHSAARLFVGKINQDPYDDLLCHDTQNGQKWVKYATPSGEFYNPWWYTNANWCSHFAGQLL